MVPLTDDAVAAGASAKTVEDILDANLWPGFDKFRVVQVRAPPRVVRGGEGGPVSPRGPGSAASETSSRAIVARRVVSSSRSLRARRAFLPAARAPPRGPSPRRGEKRTISPRLENTTTARALFFLRRNSLSTDRIRFFSTHASPPIHPPPPRPRLQGILDRNKVLIHEINGAHHTYPWDVRRAAERIRELNANLGKVQELYEEATGGFNAAALSNRRDIRASE